MLAGRRYNEGLHQAIEAKEGVEIKAENQTLATVTLQNYFRLYETISGMTGTAMTEASEFHQIYKLGVVPIPTNRPMQRIDQADLVYKTELGKFMAVTKDIIPPTINHFTDDPDLDPNLNFTFNKAQHKIVNAALSNTFGFGGHNASVIVKKYHP
jgi:hypothetical protein